MIRRVRRKAIKIPVKPTVTKRALDRVPEFAFEAIQEEEDIICVGGDYDADWTSLPDDTLIQLFSLLNYRDRASLASVCRAWRRLAASPILWTALDLRAHSLDIDMASALSGRCSKLERLRFRGAAATGVIVSLQAKGLRDLCGDACRDLSDASMSVLAAKHDSLESLQLGPDCERITSEAIKVVALCCPKLKRLRLSGVREVDGEAISALVKGCPDLTELGLLDCSSIHEGALGTATGLRLLSVAGSRSISWGSAGQLWAKQLQNLVALDASRTDIAPSAASCLLAAPQLRVLCALNCPLLEEGSDNVVYSSKSKILLARFTDLVKGLSSLSLESLSTTSARTVCGVKRRDPFLDWRSVKIISQCDKRNLELAEWTEWVLSHALLRIAESNLPGLDSFWLKQGTAVMLSLVKSFQEEVQERGATALATFVVIDDENATVDPARAEAVMNGGGIAYLLNLAKSSREGVQSEAAKVRYVSAEWVQTSSIDGFEK